jgi:hypothetical protein
VDLAGHEAVRWFQYLMQFETADGTPLWLYRHWAAGQGYLFVDDEARGWTPMETEVGGLRPHSSAVGRSRRGGRDGGWSAAPSRSRSRPQRP